MTLSKGERRERRRFIRNVRQCRRAKPRKLSPAALTAAEMARVEMFEARMMLEFSLMIGGLR